MSDPVFERYQEALKAGHLAVMQGRPKEALKHYAEAARLADHRPLPHANMGGVLLRMGRAAEALAAYERALERAPDDRAALEGRAAALLAAGRRADAASARERLVRLDEDAARRRDEEAASRSRAALRDGDPETLITMAAAAQRAGDGATAMAALLGAARGHARRREYDAALDACHRALAVDLGSAEIHLEMARLYFMRGWPERGADRLILLDRFLALEDDAQMRSEVVALARERVSDDARLAGLTGAASQR
jgi:tetratricopeptide (TPR) repeat protein